MIEFKGKISEHIKMSIYKKRLRIMGLIVLSFVAVFGICMFTVIFLDGSVSARENGYIKDVLIMLIGCTLLSLWLIIAPYSKRQREQTWEFRVKITEENISVTNVTDNIRMRKELSKIRKVSDKGEYYLLHYALIDSFICEKSLLISGTLEEFESLFEGKIK
ncbi:MAG: hypothetical protein E7670_04750 [Ruminococcaceae bacterium]|nr:hypothetical protein [Oscillospiraceae bacterium]